MKKNFVFFLLFALCFCSFAHADRRGGQINWITDFNEGAKIAQSSNKPMIVLFTGTDWCTWCIKLEDEALRTPEFAEMVGDRFVFVKLDFPLNRPMPPEVTAQNKQLQKKFGVSGFPTIVILDSHQRPLGTSGYRPGGGKQYALYLLKMVDDHVSYELEVGQIDKQSFSGLELKRLYEVAIDLGRTEEAQHIVQNGMASDQKPFFLLERYRHLAQEGGLQTEEGIAVKKELSALDPNSNKLICYQMALIDIELACKDCAKGKGRETKTTALQEYVAQLETVDQENLWRLQLLVAQMYLELDNRDKAIQMLKASCQSAPEAIQSELASSLTHLQQLQ